MALTGDREYLIIVDIKQLNINLSLLNQLLLKTFGGKKQCGKKREMN